MNTYITTHNAKIRHLCSCLVLCLHLASGVVPGPCVHSVTDEHLLNLTKLILNQVQSGCSITYSFTERQHLSEVCYIKAAFPHILDLLNTHFTYDNNSDNHHYTRSLKDLIQNIYSHECIPQINEEIEESPVKFARLHTSLPREGLQKTEEVLQMFKSLMSKSDKAVNWNCEDEYANNLPESTTALNIQTTGATECQCSCPQAMKYFMFTKSAPTSSPASYTQSKAYISMNTNEESRAPLDQNSAISPVPGPITGLYTKTELFLEERSGPAQEESTNFIMSTISDLMDNSRDSSVAMRSDPQPVTFTPTASSSELPSIQTRTLFQSATSQPTEKINTPLISTRNPVQILAKRSLDTSEQGMLSDSYFKVLWRRITENTGIRKGVKFEEITSKETENLPLVNQNSPTHLQMQLHMPRNVFKITSKEADFKDPTFRKDTEDGSDQKSIKHVKRNSVENEYQFANISIYSTFLTTSTCTLLLILTLLFYYKHRKIKDVQKEDRTVHF